MDAPPFPAAAIEAARNDARAHLRITGNAEDELIERLAATALALAEAFTGRAWIAREWTEIRRANGAWTVLEAAPVLAIDLVEAIDVDGVATSLPPDAHAIDIDADGAGWVRVTGDTARVRVTYQAGVAADWASLPAPVAQGVLLLIAHLFGDRGGADAPPAAVAALWRPWRQMRLQKTGRWT